MQNLVSQYLPLKLDRDARNIIFFLHSCVEKHVRAQSGEPNCSKEPVPKDGNVLCN